MQQLKQNEANADYRWIFFTCYDPDSGDAYAPKTGLTFASGELKIAKAGLAAANALNYASVVEAGRGGYWYPAAATELNTLGPLMLITDKADVYADPTVVQVVATNPNDADAFGLSRLDATVSSRLPTTSYETVEDWLDAANSIESGVSLREAIRYIVAYAVGNVTGGGSGTETFSAAGNPATTRFTSTPTSAGSRTVTLSGG